MRTWTTGKRQAMAEFLHATGVSGALAGISGGILTVFNFHRIRPDGPFAPSFDDGVYGPTESQFAAQVAWLAQHCDLLSEDDLIEALVNGRKRGAGRAAMITFDDGYRDNYTRALPVLRKAGVPAIFFIPAQLIDDRQLGWWDVIAWLVKRSEKLSINIQDRVVSLADKPRAICELLGWMKLQPEHETRDLLDLVATACDVALPTLAEQSAEIMTWDEIRACAEAGIAIGSHTLSHRVLSTLPVEQQLAELRNSRETILHRLGRRVRTVAYPVGGREHFSHVTMTLAAECEYDLAFSFRGADCVNKWRHIDRFDIRRVPGPDSVQLLAATVALPWLFAYG